MRRLRAVALFVLAGSVAGCATPADIQQIRREQRSIRTQLADTRASVEGVQREVASLRGKLEEARFSTRQQSGDRLGNLEARLAALERGQSEVPTGESLETSVPPSGPIPAPSPTPAAGGPVAAIDLGREDVTHAPEQYRRGLALVQQHEYDRAVQQFREFLRTNADSSLAPNARYWIGECYYALGDYSQAILQFNDVRQQFPKSDRVPAALLKIGLSFLQMGNKSEARLAFQKVANDYPSSPEAAQAREKLRNLGT